MLNPFMSSDATPMPSDFSQRNAPELFVFVEPNAEANLFMRSPRATSTDEVSAAGAADATAIVGPAFKGTASR